MNKKMAPEGKPGAESGPPDSYRCPACGEWVSRRDFAVFRRHHDHVLQQGYYTYRPSGLYPRWREKASEQSS